MCIRDSIFGGENSEIYNGAKTDAIPTPIPPTNRANIRNANEGGNVEANAETKNNNAAIIRIGFLPYLSLNAPEKKAPIIAPINAELANQPTSILFREKYCSTKLKVPEITAVSNPKSSPPSDAIKQKIAKKDLLRSLE